MSLCCPHPVFDPQVITAPSLPSAPILLPSRQEGLWWEQRWKLLGVREPGVGWRGGGVGMTAAAGGVAVLRTCEPWMSLFHMELACRVTGNTVMTAVIARATVRPPTPTPAAHLGEMRMGAPVSKKLTLDMAKTQTFMTRTHQTFISMF